MEQGGFLSCGITFLYCFNMGDANFQVLCLKNSAQKDR